MAKLKLARHQEYASALLDSLPSLGIGYGCGCGKTMTVLDWLYRHPEFARVLVICPASLREAWARAIDQMADFDGYTQDGIDRLRTVIQISSYQGIYCLASTSSYTRNGVQKTKRRYDLKDGFKGRWDAVIVDESHSLGSHSSVQTKMVLKLDADHRVAMSGTPITGGGGRCDYAKMFGQVNFLDPGFCPTWKGFMARFVRGVDLWGNPVKYDTEACERVMQDHFIFKRIDDVWDMPERIFTMMPVQLSAKARKAYDDVTKLKCKPWGFDVRTAGAQFPKLYQICSGFIYQDGGTVLDLGTAKDELLAQLLEGMDGKTVIFARFRQTIDRLCARYPDAVRYDGSSKGATWEQFVQDPSKALLITQYARGNAGLNLQCAHTIIFYETTQSALQLDQAQDRIYRPGQRNQCRYIYLYAQDTIEEKAFNSVRNGVDVTHAMMEKWVTE